MKYWIPTFLLTAMALSIPLIARDGEHEHRERHERDSNPKKHGNGEHHREHSERERRQDGEHDKGKLHHLEAKANHLRKEIELSEKHGKVEHAEKLRGHLREVHHIIERIKNGHNTHENANEEHRDHHQIEIREKAKGLQKKADYLKRQIATLERAGKKEEANKMRHHLEEVHKHFQHLQEYSRNHNRQHGERGKREEHERRLHHLRVAIENLHSAGMHDLAEELKKKAMHMHHTEDPFHNPHHHDDGRHNRNQNLELMHIIEDLKKQLHQLRNEVHQLRERR